MQGERLTPATLDPALVDRFRADLHRLRHDDGPLLLAVSGGPDSMAMLALAHAAFPDRISVATVDHRFRPKSRREARTVADWCVARDLIHAVLTVTEPAPATGRQAWARARRYDLLARRAMEVGATAVLTAHHADDQAETFLMRANRGVGLAGLRGIPARSTHQVRDALHGFPRGGIVAVHDQYDVSISRPLLGWRRAELADVVAAFGVPVADDPSNDDPKFERVRVRHLLAAEPYLNPAQLARTVVHLAEADREIEAMRAWFWQSRRVVPTGVDDPDFQTWLDLADLPRELQRRLAREAIRGVRLVSGIMPDFDLATNIEPLLDALARGKPATQAGVLVQPHGTVWRFSEAPARRTR